MRDVHMEIIFSDKWKHQVLTFTSIAVLSAVAAAPLTHASPYAGTSTSQQSHVSIAHLWINGHSVPAAAQNRVIDFPDGAMQVAIDREIARMQRRMRVSFRPFVIMPSFRLPVPVTLLSLSPETPFSKAIPRHSMNLTELRALPHAVNYLATRLRM